MLYAAVVEFIYDLFIKVNFVWGTLIEDMRKKRLVKRIMIH